MIIRRTSDHNVMYLVDVIDGDFYWAKDFTFYESIEFSEEVAKRLVEEWNKESGATYEAVERGHK